MPLGRHVEAHATAVSTRSGSSIDHLRFAQVSPLDARVEPGRIAKTLAFRGPDERAFLVVVRGDARIDNAKMKAAFNGRTRCSIRRKCWC